MLQYLMTYLQSLMRDEEGQDLIEYALIIVLIVIAAVIGMAAIGGRIAEIWAEILGWLGAV